MRPLQHLDGWGRFMARAIGLVAPKAGMVYALRRGALLNYVAGSRRGADAAWRPSNQSADALIEMDADTVRARARYLVRNSPNVHGALERIVNNVVHTGIRPQAKAVKGNGDPDTTRNQRAEADWSAWASAVNWVTAQQLTTRHWWQDGGLFVVWWIDDALRQRGLVPLNYTLYEYDHLNTSVDGEQPGGTWARRGIEYDIVGRPVAYHLFREHPNDSRLFRFYGESERIPADRVDHIFTPERASQSLGISKLAAIIMTARDLDEYQSSERIAARMAASFGLILETSTDLGAPALGGYDPTNPNKELEPPDYLESGRFQELPPGYKLSVAKSDRPGTTFEPFTKNTQKSMSVGMGVSYEAFSNDYTDSSYASARSGSLEERRGYQCQQSMLNRLLNQRAWDRWGLLRYLMDMERKPSMPVSWQNPGWPWVDPRSDAEAMTKRLAAGVTSRTKECAAMGSDFDELVRERQAEAEAIRAADLGDEILQGAQPAPVEEPNNADEAQVE